MKKGYTERVPPLIGYLQIDVLSFCDVVLQVLLVVAELKRIKFRLANLSLTTFPSHS